MTSPIKEKPKMKKNANCFIDKQKEYKTDPKYKTEMCKTWLKNNFCPYGNLCRFAHGQSDLFKKSVEKYKQKDCNSFFFHGFCLYGNRCHFKHDERRLKNIQRPSYHNYILSNIEVEADQSLGLMYKNSSRTRRLPIFKQMAENEAECVSMPVNSFLKSAYGVDIYAKCMRHPIMNGMF